ncbi:hypothetical protein BOTBODRAFT_45531 [Botryobasidium botryosum FD-172 SS1]|uniref:AMP-binding enzyme C-terminal domain-containing protein n=1 Tax=Botryobasidium botryosum (strain FD-172 SS1) TaxID=930990 RepID=A0A067MDX2_BOTB1|nr:hypothetical protein BOTBODRAFT_45531 [Botryobasidium botryosum FD-172 SS1]
MKSSPKSSKIPQIYRPTSTEPSPSSKRKKNINRPDEQRLEKRAKAVARQGHSFALADELRVGCLDEGDDLGYSPRKYTMKERFLPIVSPDPCPVGLELAEHPDILKVSVVTHPYIKWGERPMAGTSHSKTELKKFAQKRLPEFSRLEWAKAMKELPKMSTGKIQWKVLREAVAKL